MAKKTRVELNQMSTGYQQLTLAKPKLRIEDIIAKGLRRSTVVSTGTQSQQEKNTIKLKPQPLSDIEATAQRKTPLGPQNWVEQARSGEKVTTTQWLAAWATSPPSVAPVVPYADRPSVTSGSQPAKFSKKPPPLSRAGKQIVKKQAAIAKASSLVENEYLARMGHQYHEAQRTMLQAGMQAGKWKDWEGFASDKGRKQRYRAGAREALTNLVRDPKLQEELATKWNLPKEQVSQIGRDTLIGISENRYAERTDPKTGEVINVKNIANTSGDPKSRIPVGYHKGLHWSDEAMVVAPIATQPEMTRISERGELDLTDLEHKELSKSVKQGMVVTENVDLAPENSDTYDRMRTIARGKERAEYTDPVRDYDAERESGLTIEEKTNRSQIEGHDTTASYLGNKQAEPQGRLSVVAPGQPNFDEAAYTALVESDYQANVKSGRVKKMGAQLRASKKRQSVEKQWTGPTDDKNVDLAIRQHLESQLSDKLSKGSSLLTNTRGSHKLGSSWANVAVGGAQGELTSDDVAYQQQQAAASREDVGSDASYDEDKPDPKSQPEARSVLANEATGNWVKSKAPSQGENPDDFRKVKGQWYVRESSYTKRVKSEVKLESHLDKWRAMPEGSDKQVLGQQLQYHLQEEQYRDALKESSGLTLTEESHSTRTDTPHGQVLGKYFEDTIVEDPFTGEQSIKKVGLSTESSDPNIVYNERPTAGAAAITRATFEAGPDIDEETGRPGAKPEHRIKKPLSFLQKLKVTLQQLGAKYDPRYTDPSGALKSLEEPYPSGGEVGNPKKRAYDQRQNVLAQGSLISSGDRVPPGQVSTGEHPSKYVGMSEEAYRQNPPPAFLSTDQSSSDGQKVKPKLPVSEYNVRAGGFVVRSQGGKPEKLVKDRLLTGRKVQIVNPETKAKVIGYDISGGQSELGLALSNESEKSMKAAADVEAQQFRSTHGITSNAESLTPEQLSEVRANKNIKRVIGAKLTREGNSPNQVGEKISTHLSSSKADRRSSRAKQLLKQRATNQVGRKIGKALGKVPTVTAGAMPYLSLLSLAGPAVRVKEANVADFKEQQSRAIPPQLRPTDHPFPKPKMKSFTMSDYMTQYAHETFDMGTGEFPSLMQKRKQAKSNTYSI